MIPAGVEAGKNLNIVMVKTKLKILIFCILLILLYNCSTISKIQKQEEKKQSSIHPNAYSYYSMGIIEEGNGNIKKAIHYLKKAFNMEKSGEIAHEISSCYLQVNDTTNAKNYINQAISLNPNNTDHRFMLVNIYLLEKDNKNAINELKKITTLQEDSHETYFDIASIYQNIGNYEKAIHYYNKTLKIDENHKNSLYNLGNIYFTLSQKRKAKEYFEKFIKNNAEDLESKFIYAYLLTLIGEYNQSIKIYENLYEEFPENIQLIKDLAETYYLIDDIPNCKKFINIILKHSSILKKNKQLYYAMLDQIENKPEAKDSLLEILKSNETHLIANYGLYKIYLKNKNYSKLKKTLTDLGKIFFHNENHNYAIKFFNRYKKLFPKNISPYSYLGIIYESLKEYDKAIIELKSALKIKSKDIKLNYYLGVLLEANNEYKKAIKQYNRVIKLDKKHLYAYLRLGYLYNTLNQNKQNIKTLEKARTIIPEKPDIYLLLGMGYTRIKEYNKAINIFKKGITLNNSDIMLHYHLASAYDKKNDKANAIKHLQICLKLDEDDPEISNYLAYLYAEENINLDEAEKLITISLNIDNDNFAYLDTAGWIYYRKNDFQKAKKYLEQAKEVMIKKKKFDSVIFEHLIDIYDKLGDPGMKNKYIKELEKRKNNKQE